MAQEEITSYGVVQISARTRTVSVLLDQAVNIVQNPGAPSIVAGAPSSVVGVPSVVVGTLSIISISENTFGRGCVKEGDRVEVSFLLRPDRPTYASSVTRLET